MTKVGVFKQVYGEYTSLYAIAETMPEAEDIAREAWRNKVQLNCHFFVRTVSDNAVIGECI